MWANVSKQAWRRSENAGSIAKTRPSRDGNGSDVIKTSMARYVMAHNGRRWLLHAPAQVLLLLASIDSTASRRRHGAGRWRGRARARWTWCVAQSGGRCCICFQRRQASCNMEERWRGGVTNRSGENLSVSGKQNSGGTAMTWQTGGGGRRGVWQVNMASAAVACCLAAMAWRGGRRRQHSNACSRMCRAVITRHISTTTKIACLLNSINIR